MMSNSGDLKYRQITQIFLLDISTLLAVIILLAIHTDIRLMYKQCEYLKIEWDKIQLKYNYLRTTIRLKR